MLHLGMGVGMNRQLSEGDCVQRRKQYVIHHAMAAKKQNENK